MPELISSVLGTHVDARSPIPSVAKFFLGTGDVEPHCTTIRDGRALLTNLEVHGADFTCVSSKAGRSAASVWRNLSLVSLSFFVLGLKLLHVGLSQALKTDIMWVTNRHRFVECHTRFEPLGPRHTVVQGGLAPLSRDHYYLYYTT